MFSHAGSLQRDVLIAAFVAIGLWETLRPFRRTVTSTPRRWLDNASLTVCLYFIYWLAIPTSTVLFAASIPPDRWGLLNSASTPFLLRILLAFLLLDLVRFGSHWVLHAVPVLWRIHKVHHTDHDLDLTTGFRFHPLEALFVQGAVIGAIFLLAPPPIAVLVSELVMAVHGFMSHANVALPPFLEAPLRYLLITPHLHRVHHSIDVEAQNKNFGTCLSCWDRLFGSYRDTPLKGDTDSEMGLREIDLRTGVHFLHLLAMPFRRN